MIMADQPRPARAFGAQGGKQGSWIYLEAVLGPLGNVPYGFGVIDPILGTEQEATDLLTRRDGGSPDKRFKQFACDLKDHPGSLARQRRTANVHRAMILSRAFLGLGRQRLAPPEASAGGASRAYITL